jgi:hypothetical protein
MSVCTTVVSTRSFRTIFQSELDRRPNHQLVDGLSVMRPWFIPRWRPP